MSKRCPTPTTQADREIGISTAICELIERRDKDHDLTLMMIIICEDMIG